MAICQEVAAKYKKNEEFNSEYKKYGGQGGLFFVKGLFGILGGEKFTSELEKSNLNIDQSSSKGAQ